MSAKNVDKHNRFRSITVGFRVSPEENEELNRAVALSGLPKQEYCYRKCMGRELERIAAGDCVAEELLRTIGLIAATMNGIKGDNADD